MFENKLQSEETWKLYKRDYKKYCARVMKGNMSREDFNAWVERAAAKQDSAILLLEATKGAEKRAALRAFNEKRGLPGGVPSGHQQRPRGHLGFHREVSCRAQLRREYGGYRVKAAGPAEPAGADSGGLPYILCREGLFHESAKDYGS